MIKYPFKPWLVLCCLFLSSPLLAQQQVKIGISMNPADLQPLMQWMALAPALTKAIPRYNFTVKFYDIEALATSVASRQIDFVLTDPSLLTLLNHRYGLSAPLASLNKIVQGKPVASFGGVIFTRSDQSSIQTLADIRGKSIAAVSVNSFAGYQMQAYELQQAGVVMSRDTQLKIMSISPDKLIDTVLSKQADVGFVRSGVIESLVAEGKLEPSKIKVINRQKLFGFPLQVSTRLYPEWVLASMPHTDKKLSRKVASFLFNLEEDQKLAQILEIQGFDIPQDYTSVDTLLRELRIPPFDVSPNLTLSDIWQHYRWQIITITWTVLFIVFLTLRLFTTNRRLSESQNELRVVLNESQVAIAWADDAGLIQFINPKFTTLFGYTLEDIPTLQAWYLKAYPDAEYRLKVMNEWQVKVAASLSDKKPIASMELTITCKNGSVCYVILLGSWFGSRLLANFSDITERKLAEDKLVQKERHLRAILESTSQCVKLVSKKGELLSMNTAGLRMLEVDKTSVVDQSIYQFIAPGSREAFRLFNEQVCAGLSGTIEFEVIGLQGTHRWVESHAVPFQSISDSEMVQLAFTQDITQRKQSEQLLKLSEARFKAIFNQAAVGFAQIDTLTGQFVLVNHRYTEICGVADDGLYAITFMNITHPDDLETDLNYMEALKAGHIRSFTMEKRYFRPDGSIVWVDLTVSPLWQPGERPNFHIAVIQDITQRKQNEHMLSLFQRVFESALEGIIITNTNSEIVEVNPAFSIISGYSREEVLGNNPRILKSGHMDKACYLDMWQALLKTGHWAGEMWNRRKNGEIYPEWLSISTIDNTRGETTHYVGIFTDISLLKQREKQLEYLAHYDSLTNIPNRVLLLDRMQQGLAHSRREKKLLAICYLDLDGFKPINDSQGHEAGDNLLIKMAKTIKDSLRDGDTVARLGGDEFVILLLGIDNLGDCQVSLERLLLAINQPIAIKDQVCQITASIGVTLYPLDDEDPDTLLRHADQAMYLAKQSGKNRYHIFDPNRDAGIKVNQALRNRIEYAINAQEFELFYQPKVAMIDNSVVGAEALIRWRHPERGLLTPIEFLPIIENTELEIQVGDWVIENALRQLSLWQQSGIELEVSINISATHLQSPGFTDTLKSKLSLYSNVKPTLLQIEILETVALADISSVALIINSCLALGVGFALDDFGTGYSSLVYLRKLPVGIIKIDQSFVRNMLIDREDYVIVQGIVALAKAFHCTTVAEGVETVQHFQVLLEMGCDISQGYGIAKPMPAENIIPWCHQYASL